MQAILSDCTWSDLEHTLCEGPTLLPSERALIYICMHYTHYNVICLYFDMFAFEFIAHNKAFNDTQLSVWMGRAMR